MALAVGLALPAGAVADTTAPAVTVTPVECYVSQPDGSLVPVPAPEPGGSLTAAEICITSETLTVRPVAASNSSTTRHKRARRHHRRHHRTRA